MKNVTVYTMNYCPYCTAAKKLLQQKGIAFEEVFVAEDDEATWKMLEKKTGYKTMPQIFIDSKFVGGFSELTRIDESGELDALVK